MIAVLEPLKTSINSGLENIKIIKRYRRSTGQGTGVAKPNDWSGLFNRLTCLRIVFTPRHNYSSVFDGVTQLPDNCWPALRTVYFDCGCISDNNTQHISCAAPFLTELKTGQWETTSVCCFWKHNNNLLHPSFTSLRCFSYAEPLRLSNKFERARMTCSNQKRLLHKSKVRSSQHWLKYNIISMIE